jgi:hypothetical protein
MGGLGARDAGDPADAKTGTETGGKAGPETGGKADSLAAAQPKKELTARA